MYCGLGILVCARGLLYQSKPSIEDLHVNTLSRRCKPNPLPMGKCVVAPSRDRSEAIASAVSHLTQVSGTNTTQLRTRSYAIARSYGIFRVCDAERWRALSA